MAIYYVSKDGDDGWAGNSWSTAWKTIDKALSSGGAPVDSEIWVAQGIYTENQIDMDNRAYIYGGFAGNEIARAQRSYLRNKTILKFVSGTNHLYNSWHGGRLDGFWIIECTSTNAPILLRSGLGKTDVFTVANCIFKDNDRGNPAMGSTFGSLAILGNASPIYAKHIVENCIFDSNKSKYTGGIYMYYFNGVIRDCVFMNNQNEYDNNYGHELCNAGDSDPIIEHNLFWDSYGGPGAEDWTTFEYNNLFYQLDDPVGSNNNMRRYPWFINRDNDNYGYYNVSACVSGGTNGGSIGPGSVAEVLYDFDNPMIGHNSVEDPFDETQVTIKPIREIAMKRNSYTAFNIDGKLMHEVILSDKAEIKLKWDAVDHLIGNKTTQTAKELYNVFRKIKETGNYPHFIPDPDLIIDPSCRFTTANNGYYSHYYMPLTVTNYLYDDEIWVPKSPGHIDFHDMGLDNLITYDSTGNTYQTCNYQYAGGIHNPYGTYYIEADLSNGGLGFNEIIQRITIDMVVTSKSSNCKINHFVLYVWRHDTEEWLELETFYDTWDSGADFEDKLMVIHHVLLDKYNIFARYFGDTDKLYFCLVYLYPDEGMQIHHARICLNSYVVRWKSVFGLQNWQGMYNMLFEIGKAGTIDLVEV